MRSRSKTLLAAALIGAGLAAATSAPAFAAETANSEFVIIQPDDVLEDDLYAGAVKVSVEGVIEGDLIAFAAEEVVIAGRVTGSVLVVAPDVSIDGEVGGSARIVANSLQIEGEVGEDVVVAGRVVRLGEGSSIGGDVLAWVLTMSSRGGVGGSLEGNQGSLRLSGDVSGDVDVSVGRLIVVDELVVDGDLGYRSNREADGLGQASVQGTVVRKTQLPPNIRARGLALLGRFLAIIFLTVSALSVAYGWPERTRLATEKVRGAPLRSWGYGALVMLSPLILTGITALILAFAPAAASFPLLVILGPLILAMLGLVVAISLVAGTPAVAVLGKLVFNKLELYGAVLAGSALAGLAWLLPWVGWFVPLLTLPLGLGAWFLSWSSKAAPAREVGAGATAQL